MTIPAAIQKMVSCKSYSLRHSSQRFRRRAPLPPYSDATEMAAMIEEVRFAADSPLEGDGFEPSVPHKKQPFLAAPVRSRNSPSATKIGSFVPGTDGSNPSPSSRESGANQINGGQRWRRQGGAYARDQDAVGCGQRLQAGGEVRSFADHFMLRRGTCEITDDDQPGGDPRPVSVTIPAARISFKRQIAISEARPVASSTDGLRPSW
jgi:hypothetical protein